MLDAFSNRHYFEYSDARDDCAYQMKKYVAISRNSIANVKRILHEMYESQNTSVYDLTGKLGKLVN